MPLDLVNPDRPIRVGVILMKGETEILDVAPVDFLNGISHKFINFLPFPDSIKAQALDVEFYWVNEDGEDSKLTAGLTLKPTHSFKNCPPLDILGANTVDHEPTEGELDFIRQSYEHCAAFLTICGGFLAPMKAGIFQGKTVTAPRFILESLRKENPGAKWVERRWQRDGKLWTSGALLNGLDCMRAFARDTWGPTRGEMIEATLEIGGWPVRDDEYKDVDGVNGKM